MVCFTVPGTDNILSVVRLLKIGGKIRKTYYAALIIIGIIDLFYCLSVLISEEVNQGIKILQANGILVLIALAVIVIGFAENKLSEKKQD